MMWHGESAQFFSRGLLQRGQHNLVTKKVGKPQEDLRIVENWRIKPMERKRDCRLWWVNPAWSWTIWPCINKDPRLCQITSSFLKDKRTNHISKMLIKPVGIVFGCGNQAGRIRISRSNRECATINCLLLPVFPTPTVKPTEGWSSSFWDSRSSVSLSTSSIECEKKRFCKWGKL